MKDTKSSGQVFTPVFLVRNILDVAGYDASSCLRKHVIDNSCGDGAFLCEIVKRYCEARLHNGNNLAILKEELQTYIHGIEVDSDIHRQCLHNLDVLVQGYGLTDVKWDIINADTLAINDYNGRMDFVVGNPPYVRVHNLQDNYDYVKTFVFAEGGMTDLYLVFFEIGFQMLAERGKLCYITPSSWLSSVAGNRMREHIFQKRNLKTLIDLKHFQPFAATTYTIISLFQKEEPSNTFIYGQYHGDDNVVKYIAEIDYKNAFIGGNIYLANNNKLNYLNAILNYRGKNYVAVKNGFATLADKVFIQHNLPFSKFIIPIIKASTGKWATAFYPYDDKGNPIAREQLMADSNISDFLSKNKDRLLKGKDEVAFPNWHLYGRTQALRDVCKNKVSINTCIKDIQSIKLNPVPAGAGIYSGLYILGDVDINIIRDIILSSDFISYISLLRKYKSGGYYTFSSHELQNYINYNISKRHGNGK